MNKVVLFLSFFILCSSCSLNHRQQKIAEEMVRWVGHEIYFPEELVYTVQLTDTLNDVMKQPHDYAIISYIDTTGCTSCEMKLPLWEKFMQKISTTDSIQINLCLILYATNKNDIQYLLKYNEFKYPVCLDMENCFWKANQLPPVTMFHTFLLDKDNRIIALGNPVQNMKIEELYLKIIRGETGNQESETLPALTTVDVDRTEVNMGRFDWHGEQKAEFTLTNTGDSPLVIYSVDTSCGCTRVEYDLQPVRPGEKRIIRVFYKADALGHFHKSVRVQCNTEASSLQLAIRGEGVTAL